MQEGLLPIQLPGSADGAVAGELFLQVIAEEQPDAEAVCTEADQRTVTVNIVELPHQQDLEEDDGIDALLALTAVVRCGDSVEITKIKRKLSSGTS